MEADVQARLEAAVAELGAALDEAGDEGPPYLLEALARVFAAQGEELPPMLAMLFS